LIPHALVGNPAARVVVACVRRDAGRVAPVPATCHEPAPCVYVTPDPTTVRTPGTVFTYHGRGWPANVEVEASYGSYGSPKYSVCAGVGPNTGHLID
jgi:hypothetical protein